MQSAPLEQLYKALAAGQVDEVRRFFRADPEELRRWKWLHSACGYDSVDMVAMLVEEFGMDVNAPESPGHPSVPLNDAIRNNCFSVARWLLDHGAKVNIGGGDYATPLGSSATAGDLKMVALLLERKADPNVLWGWPASTPRTNALKQALLYGHQDVAQLLREHGAVLPPGDKEETPPPPPDTLLGHIEQHFGKPQPLSLHEIVPGDPPITIHIVPIPSEEQVALVTTGMSDRPLTVPPDGENWQFAELMIYLPKDWPLTPEALKDPNNFWPIEWLRRLAHYPHVNNTWLGGSDAIFSNGEPPGPLAPNTKLSCILAMTRSTNAGWAQLSDGRLVAFYTLYPIYTEERDIAKQSGTQELIELIEIVVGTITVDVTRPSVADFLRYTQEQSK